MILNKKNIIVFLILIGAFVIVGSVYAHEMSDSTSLKSANIVKKVSAKTQKVNVKIYNFKSGMLWGPKAVKLKNGDAIAGYVTTTGNSQFDKGTGVTSWYIGNGLNGDMVPHHTKLIKAKFYFKNSKGKVKTKTATGGSGHIRTDLINGYTPYKAVVYYKTV